MFLRSGYSVSGSGHTFPALSPPRLRKIQQPLPPLPLPNSFHFTSPFSGEGVSKSRRWRGEEGVNEVGRRRWRSEERIGEQKKHNWKHSTYYSAYFTYPLSYTINTKYIHSISRTLLFGRNYNHSAIGKVTLPERL